MHVCSDVIGQVPWPGLASPLWNSPTSGQKTLEESSGVTARPNPEATTDGPRIGQPAPPFTMRALDGGTVRLDGQLVIINFRTSWWTPCRQEAPLFRDFSERASTKLAII